MRDIFKDLLFNHRILVCEEKESLNEAFAARYILSSAYGLRIVSGQELVTKDMVEYTAHKLGEMVPEPFYRGFPESVRSLSSEALIFDQLLHYAITYGTGDFSEAGHSVLEDQDEFINRTSFNEKTDIKDFTVLCEKDAVNKLKEFADDIFKSTRPISIDQYAFVCECIDTFDWTPRFCASKNLAIKLLMRYRNLSYAIFIKLPDVVKLVDEINYCEYGNRNVKKLNLKNKDRKFIASIIDILVEKADADEIIECFEKKAIWAGLLHHIHYIPKSTDGIEFVDFMRGSTNLSVYSAFENGMARGDIESAVWFLKKTKGVSAVLRNLSYILSRCTTNDAIEYVLEQIAESKNGIVLMQLLLEYVFPEDDTRPRTFKFTKHNLMVVHEETMEAASKRKSRVPDAVKKIVAEKLKNAIQDLYSEKLGKVYIDPDMKNIALPIQESTASSGFGILPKGSRIHIPECKKIRAFTYWEKVDDIDLSVIGITENYEQVEFSWRTMWNKQSSAITYSGDETSGYNGGSEYFDIDILEFRSEHSTIKYLVFCNNVFSRSTFSNCICRAGYMDRDILDSGEVYEPKTVKSSFTVNADSTFAYLFAIDLEARDFIWLNVARDSSCHVAGNTKLDFLIKYFNVAKLLNFYDFFSMLSSKVVEKPFDADVIVSDASFSPMLLNGKEIIRSCDIERVTALMNLK